MLQSDQFFSQESRKTGKKTLSNHKNITSTTTIRHKVAHSNNVLRHRSKNITLYGHPACANEHGTTSSGQSKVM